MRVRGIGEGLKINTDLITLAEMKALSLRSLDK